MRNQVVRTLVLVCVATLAWIGKSPAEDPTSSDEDSAIHVPTPNDVVAKMLEVAKVTDRDLLYDLGCGDGRIVIAAASKYGCRAIGYDIDARKVRESRENVTARQLDGRVQIEQRDIFKIDLKQASVITLFLLPEMNSRLVPQLAQLKAGSRVVCHEFPIEGYAHDEMVTLKSKEDGVPRDIYLYKIPLKKSEQ